MRKYFSSFFLALLLHLGIISLFMLNISEDTPTPAKQKKMPEIIQASIMDENLVIAKAQQLKQQQESTKHQQQQQKDAVAKQIKQEKKRLQQAKNNRLKEEKLAKEQAKQLKKTAQEEQQKLLVIKQKLALENKKRLAEEKKRVLEKKRKVEAEQVAEEKRKNEAAKKELARKKAAKQKKIAAEKKRRENEENLRIAAIKQAADNKIHAENVKIAKQATANAVDLITLKVIQNWNRPNSVTGKLTCTIRVNLIPGGDVMNVKVIKSSGDPLFDASVERAVYKATPLPVPKDTLLFNKKFRNLTFVFAPKMK